MQVTLIDYTGKGSLDPLYAAKLLAYTKNTRLVQGDESRDKIFKMGEEELLQELDYISKTIRSSWEFIDFTFEIKDVTRAFTHQFVRTRTASYAQQTQRTINMGEFTAEVPETIKNDEDALHIWNNCMEVISKSYQVLAALGIPSQDCRGLLPTNVHTNIIAKMNLRTLADLLGKRKNLRAQGEYADIAREMERIVLGVMPWTKVFLDPERNQTPALDQIMKETLGDKTPFSDPKINQALKEIDMLKGTWG